MTADVQESQTVARAVGDMVLESGISAGDEWVTVAPDKILAALEQLKAEGFEQLSFLTAVDHLSEIHSGGPAAALETQDDHAAPARFEIVYELRSYSHRRLVRVRTFPPGEFPSLPTASTLYPNANWDERETWDLFGINFEGHPDLTRILLPDDWVGHPLRRDHPMGGEIVDFSDDQEAWHTAPHEQP